MKGNEKCFILSDSGEYEEITYAELLESKESDPEYADKLYIRLHGALMEVTEADYHDYHKDRRRQKYIDEEAALNGECSYDALDNGLISGEDIIRDESPPVAVQAMENVLIEEMLRSFGRLIDSDRELLEALYFDGISERKLAQILNIPRNTLAYHKSQALERLRFLMKI